MTLPEFYIKPEQGHKWAICGGCGLMVLCGRCGNNCCNGGYGTVDGEDCPDCPSAYEFQKEYTDEAATFYEYDLRKWKEARDKDPNDSGPDTMAGT